MTTKPDPNATPLPGLEAVENRGVTDLEVAIRRTIAAFDKDGLLSERHAGYTAMAVELAQIIGVKKAAGRLSTASNDFRELRELLDALAPEADAMDPALAAALEAWNTQ